MVIETKDLPINSLDYDGIRENFVSFLKGQIGSDRTSSLSRF